MLVHATHLPFDLAKIVSRAVTDWEATERLHWIGPVHDSCGDFIVQEMESHGLRELIGDETWFNDAATPDDFRACVFKALDHWLMKVSEKRTREEMEDYRRECGE